MESQTALINRAIAMHLLREGQFGVASTFIAEAQPQGETLQSPSPEDRDEPPSIMVSHHNEPPDAMITDADIPSDLTAFQSQKLQEKFADMYSILSSLKQHDLHPAIRWARAN